MNTTIEHLLSRTSVPKADAPAPSEPEIELLLQAAGRACDHKRLRPYRFIRIQGEQALERFGQLMVSAQAESQGAPLDDEFAAKLSRKPMRAPMIMAVVASPVDEPKVPEIEQIITAGCAAQMMVTAAHAMGLAAMWRSGSMMYTQTMAEGLALAEHESMVGLLYIGSHPGKSPRPQPLASQDYLSEFI